MQVVAVSVSHDHSHPGFKRLARTLQEQKWDVLHIQAHWRGFVTKLVETRNALPRLKALGNTHVVFNDAYDVLCYGTPAEFEEKWSQFKCSMLISCERAVWPDAHLEPEYPRERKSDFCHINSGGYAAEIDYLAHVLEGCDNADDDQRYLTRKYLDSPFTTHDAPITRRIERDDGCVIFQSLAHQQDHDLMFEITDGRIRNRVTNTKCLFAHANGGGSSSNYHSWLPNFEGSK